MAMNTDAPSNRKDLQNKSSTEKVNHQKCAFCESDNHYLPKCSSFTKRSLDERRKFIRDQRRCYGCLRVGHDSHDCKQKHTCQTCKSKHPTCLHDDNFQMKRDNETASQENTNTTPKANATAATLNTSSKDDSTTSTVLPVWVSTKHNPEQEKLVYALLDTQSNTTFVDKATCEALNAQAQPIRLKITTMTQKESSITCEKVTGLRVRGYASNITIDIPSAYTREAIPLDPAHIPTNETAKNWKHLRSIANDIPPLLECDIGLLIGYNCSQALVPREVITGKDKEPFALRTDLGWSIVGRASPTANCFNITGICHRTLVKESPSITPSDALRLLEKDFQDVEVSNKTVSQEDLQFLSILQDGIKKNDAGHCQMPLPFRQPPSLSDNRSMAITRLNQLKRRLERNATYCNEYVHYMNELIKRGDAELIPETDKGPRWYIPHHGVYHPQKKKLRVVFDCSARFSGTSLNDQLLHGPDMTNNLAAVLLRFRQNPIAIMCDVEKMFHQFHVNEEHRDFLRFLWWEDGDLSTTPKDYRMKVHLFGATSSPSCANYGLKHLAKENKPSYPLGASFIERNFYVDDGLTSETSTECALDVVNQARAICATGNLRLHKFVSNSREVMEKIPPSERAPNIQELDLTLDELPMERALGMEWSVQTDTIHFSHTPSKRQPTRRNILSTVAAIYDPLGLVAPFTLQGKQILQEMCRKGTGWDDSPPADLHQKWEVWIADLEGLKSVKIPRCYFPETFNSPSRVELHHFSDASMVGYGMCTYLRAQNQQGDIHCSLVAAKARVAPTKITTIPRLELSAALLSAEVSAVIKEELDLAVNEEFFWTDSRVVLGYLNNEARKFHIFVANLYSEDTAPYRPQTMALRAY